MATRASSARRPAAPRDEWAGGPEDAASVCYHLRGVIEMFSAAELERLSRMAHELIRDQGIVVHHDATTERDPRRGHAGRTIPFDLLPLPIGASEWAEIEAGLTQRLKGWNAFLNDIFSSQEILKAGAIPYEVVYADPHFHRECVGIRVTQDIAVHIAAVDLVRGRNGKWAVLEDNISNPTGASYALQNRRVLSQVFPQLMENVSLAPVFGFPTRLLETLQSAAPTSTGSARVVSLSPGLQTEGYYDHSFLARQMGIPLVQGSDLIVLDGELYMKTIGGLDRVDVLYRRLGGQFIDPVSFRTDSQVGVPGLLSCLRKGTLTVANSLGTGLGDNRALAAYMPQILEFYLGERPLLPSVPVRPMRDLDQREQVCDDPAGYVFKRSSSRGAESVWIGRQLDEAAWSGLKAAIDRNPCDFVAQPLVDFSTAPCWIGGRMETRRVSLRVFVLNGSQIHVSPCVLTRVAAAEGDETAEWSGGMKDTWVLRGRDRETPSHEIHFRHSPRRMRLASRTAEALYWIGRYAERLESTVRILRVVQQLRTEDSVQADPRAWHPLWEAMASATGHPTRFFKRASFHRPRANTLATYILLDERNASSALICARVCRQNALQVREAIPPEFWTVLNRLYLHLALLSETRKAPEIRQQLEDLSLHDELLEMSDELSGAADKHMLHNDVRHFWNLGRHGERGIFTVLTLRQVYLKRSGERDPGAVVAEDTNLDALLRMLAGQYAYRSSYRSRPVASQVARLLLQDVEFPRSLLFCLMGQQYALQRAFGNRPPPLAEAPIRHVSHLVSELNFADIGKYFTAIEALEPGLLAAGTQPAAPLAAEDPAGPAASRRIRMKAFADWLQELHDRIAQFHLLVTDHFFSHQAGAPGESI